MNEIYWMDKKGYRILFKKETTNGLIGIGLSMGTHPNGYILIPKDHRFYGKDYDKIQKFKNVLTYSGKKLNGLEVLFPHHWFIGWDHAHFTDYYHNPSHFKINSKRHKWTLEELKNEMIEELKIAELSR